MKKILIATIPVALIGYWIYKGKFFEKDKPEISLITIINKEEKSIPQGHNYWNPRLNMELRLKDESGIRSYRITASRSDGVVVLDKQEIITKRPKLVKVLLPRPNVDLLMGDKIFYKISVNDWSNSNFFNGNTQNAQYDFTIDTKAPIVRMIANSYRIVYGGSALLIFQIQDESTKEVVVTNGEDIFKPFPFIKPGYYAVSIAWPIKNKTFNGSIYAMDSAFNVKKVGIPIVKSANIYYRFTDLTLKDNFLNTKPDELIKIIGERAPSSFSDSIAKFKYLNEDVRLRDENIINRTSKMIDFGLVSEAVSFHPFLPLKRSEVVGYFGDHRTYHYHDRKISQSIHLGLDIANFKHAPITSSNPGKVVFSGALGIYGNTIIVNHGMGLASLYSHASKLNFKVGDKINAGEVIASTGRSGWALGDHLHLGVLIQGHPVRVKEWMDPRWIKVNINEVFTKAQKIIQDSK